MSVRSFNAFYVWCTVGASALEEARRLGKAVAQYRVQRVLRVSGGKRTSVVERHAVAHRESECQPIIGSLNVRSELRHVIELFVLLHQGIKDQYADPFAGRIDRRRADWIDCLDVI